MDFLAKDIASHPPRLKTLSPETAKRIAKLTKSMTFDSDEAIEGDVDL